MGSSSKHRQGVAGLAFYSELGVSMIVWVAKHREGDTEDLGHLFWIDS